MHLQCFEISQLLICHEFLYEMISRICYPILSSWNASILWGLLAYCEFHLCGAFLPVYTALLSLTCFGTVCPAASHIIQMWHKSDRLHVTHSSYVTQSEWGEQTPNHLSCLLGVWRHCCFLSYCTSCLLAVLAQNFTCCRFTNRALIASDFDSYLNLARFLFIDLLILVGTPASPKKAELSYILLDVSCVRNDISM